jgi:hypothetical protein
MVPIQEKMIQKMQAQTKMKSQIKDISFFLKNFNHEQLYWRFTFGPSKRKISPDELKKRLDQIEKPVFFLSTGRTGTMWLARLFSHDRGIKSFHAPAPDLAGQNLFAYALQKNQALQKEQVHEILSQVFLAGRETYLRYSYKCMRRYLETNNHIGFFAYTIAELLPQARFIHILRHPGDFVSSGLKRNWYSSGEQEIRQIVPLHGRDKEAWPGYHDIQKIGWLWKETNSYIDTFKQSVPSEKVFTLDFSSMDMDSIKEMIEFAGAAISEKQIRKTLKRRLNQQQFQSSERYPNWPEAHKQMLAEICGPLVKKYQYKL